MYIVVETITDVYENEMLTYKLGTTDSALEATEIMFDDIKTTQINDFGYTEDEANKYVQELPSSIEHYINADGESYYKWIILEL